MLDDGDIFDFCDWFEENWGLGSLAILRNDFSKGTEPSEAFVFLHARSCR
jgi:hypothetical protein